MVNLIIFINKQLLFMVFYKYCLTKLKYINMYNCRIIAINFVFVSINHFCWSYAIIVGEFDYIYKQALVGVVVVLLLLLVTGGKQSQLLVRLTWTGVWQKSSLDFFYASPNNLLLFNYWYNANFEVELLKFVFGDGSIFRYIFCFLFH